MCTTIRGGGTEGIEPAEEWKSPRHMQHSPRAAEVRGHEVREMVHFHLWYVWSIGVIPDDWYRGIILPFYKGKGSRHDCQNYGGITLLSVSGKGHDLVTT